MLNFIKKRSYDLVTIFITQIAISIFGFALWIAIPSPAQGEAMTSSQFGLRVVTSIFAIMFFLFLTYSKVWNLGYKDIKGLDRRDAGYSRLGGLFIGIGACLINLIVAVVHTLIYVFTGEMSVVTAAITYITEGMYTGILTLTVGGVPLNNYIIMYYAILIPLIVTCTVAYYAGSKDFKIFAPRNAKK